MRRILVSLIIGLVIGLVVAVFIGWGTSPVQYIQLPMSYLYSSYQDNYTVMVAAAYQVDGDLNEAIRRLQPLGMKNIPLFVRDVTERYISNSGTGNEADIRTLVILSRALGYYTPPMQAFALPTPIPTPGS